MPGAGLTSRCYAPDSENRPGPDPEPGQREGWKTMVDLIDGFTPYAVKDAEKYNRLRWWPGLTFGDILDRAADMFPDKVAFVDADSHLTYTQARERVNRLAVSLMDLGIQPTDRVLVQLAQLERVCGGLFRPSKDRGYRHPADRPLPAIRDQAPGRSERGYFLDTS